MNELNSSQRAVVDYEGMHLLVIAGPGTGKTHTLIRRIEKMAGKLSQGQEILAITFTHKAAGEMRRRLTSRLTDIEKKIFVGTFHQFCLHVLRGYIEETTLPRDFQVATVEECEALIQHLWPQKTLKERRALQETISRWKALDDLTTPPEEVLIYNEKLRQIGRLDFDDLLLETLMLLRAKGHVQAQVHEIYPYIFVDEYQDINPVQQALLKSLAGSRGAITAIGDPNQAIYGFRGADVRSFERFEKDFQGAVTVTLSENYRSAPNLLLASSQVMAKAQSFPIAELTARIYIQGRLTIYEAATDRAEAEYVVHQIEKMVGGTSMYSHDSGRVAVDEQARHGFGDIAVLYRLNSQRPVLQKALERSGIPYHIACACSSVQDNTDQVCPYRGGEITLNAEKISLMTLHAAKGLEFPVVFIVGCEQNILPLNLEGLRSDVEEERRLFYVGMTRARECLYLLRAKRRRLYGKTYDHEMSAFVRDIEEELKEYATLKAYGKKQKSKDRQLSLFS